MVLTILITFISLISLLVLHEFSHFILAKKFGVKVEEFGIGYPPRLIGKKIGETIYSINLLPFGAFVKILGEEERIDDPRSFNKKPIWQRILIILGGVVSFWIIAVILLSVIAGVWGLPISISDEADHNLRNPKVQITQVVPESPAEKAGLQIGDIIKKLRAENLELTTDKVKEVIEFTRENKGKEITLVIQRGKKVFDISLIPRASPPEGEGPMGVGLARVASKIYPWNQAPIEGARVVKNATIGIPYALGNILWKMIRGEPIKEKIEARGIVGIGELLVQAAERGIDEFLYLISIISIYVALFNVLPIPALDGGKLLFLAIEKFKGQPVNPKIEQRITAFFFAILLLLAIWVTIKDITKLF